MEENAGRIAGEMHAPRKKHPLSYTTSILMLLRPVLLSLFVLGAFNAVFYHLPTKDAFEVTLSLFSDTTMLTYFIMLVLAWAVLERFDRNKTHGEPQDFTGRQFLPAVLAFFAFTAGSVLALNYLSFGLSKLTITYAFSVLSDTVFYSAWLFMVLTVLYFQKHHDAGQEDVANNAVFFGALAAGLFRAVVKSAFVVFESYHATGGFSVPGIPQIGVFLASNMIVNSLFAIFVISYFIIMNGSISRWFYVAIFMRMAAFFIYPTESFPFSSVVAAISFYFFMYAVAHYLGEKHLKAQLDTTFNYTA
jgi:hypothetical protein